MKGPIFVTMGIDLWDAFHTDFGGYWQYYRMPFPITEPNFN